MYSSDVISLPEGTSPPSYTLARVADYTQHEEQRAQIHLAKWALDLQRSLQNERQRYAALARGDRAVWLTEQLKEIVMDGSLVPITQSPGELHIDRDQGGVVLRAVKGEHLGFSSGISPHDPLGVVWWTDDLKRRGWVLVQILGSVGVVGGLALWLARTWGVPTRNMAEWNFNFHWTGAS